MENTKVYTQQELYDKKIDTDDYRVNKESGAFLGTLMLKAWATRSKVSGNSRPMRAFFDLEDGRKIIALVQPFRKEQLIAMGKIPIGSTLQLYFEPSTSGYVFYQSSKLFQVRKKIEDSCLKDNGTRIRNVWCSFSLFRQLLTNENAGDLTHLPGSRLSPDNVLIQLS